MTRLTVKIDHVATVRQARRAVAPDPVHAAVLAELGGADGIGVHLRGDRRHVQDRDVEVLRQVVRTSLTLEMAATQEMVRMALTLKPDQVTLVPERLEEVTTEGGLDAVLNSVQLVSSVKTLQEAGVRVCLFVESELEQVKEAHKLGAQAIEINTAGWAGSTEERDRDLALRKITDAARLGLTYANVARIATLAEVSELRIGHAVVARSILVGMERAVRDMVEAIRSEASGQV
jgi:pyridoxine 5-phosphate synthase